MSTKLSKKGKLAESITDNFQKARLGKEALTQARILARENILKEYGFSQEEIKLLQEKVENLDVRPLSICADLSVTQYIPQAIRISTAAKKPVVFKHNHNVVLVLPTKDVRIFSSSPDSLQEEKDNSSSIQVIHKNMLREQADSSVTQHIALLENLDFQDPIAPLTWLSHLQELGGINNSQDDRRRVIEIFERAGYKTMIQLERETSWEAPEKYKLSIIQEALEGVITHGRPPKRIQTAIEEYLERFKFC